MKCRSRAPLRLGLGGGGTDVSPYSDVYGGAVLNATIDMYAYATVEPLSNDVLEIVSLDRGASHRFEGNERLDGSPELRLPIGVYEAVVEAFCSGRRVPLRLTSRSDAPAGSGLGASSALVVAMVGAMAEYLRLPLGEYEIAKFAYEVERVRLKLTGGKQDQYAATFGGFNFMEFSAGDKVIVNPLRIKKDYVNELQYNMLLYYTGTSRISSEIINQQVSNFEHGQERAVEAMHRLKEQAIAMKEALLQGQIDRIGEIFDYGWRYKKDMADNITNVQIDEIYETALKSGARGGKITGAGGGGFLMLYCDGDQKGEVAKALERFGGKTLPFEFSMVGLESWSVNR